MLVSASQQQVCRECGRVFTGAAVLGQCPSCLMAAALAPHQIQTDTAGKRLADPTSSDLEKIFPELEIVECLGKGGMAAVYKVRHRTMDRIAALKILLVDPLDDPIMADRFAAEGDILKSIDHPHVVRGFAAGERAGFLYLLLELVQGPSLRQVIQSGQIVPATAIYAGVQISNGVAYVHQRGYIHRDIKPDNILLHSGTEPFSGSLSSFLVAGGRLRLADFGLATAAVEKPGARQLTLPYQRLGTPDYMAPECRHGISRADLRMDVFSLGVVIYEMLTGDLPVGRYQLPSKKCGVISEVDDILMRCLEPDPTRRYADAGAVRHDLTLALQAMRRKKSWMSPFNEST